MSPKNELKETLSTIRQQDPRQIASFKAGPKEISSVIQDGVVHFFRSDESQAAAVLETHGLFSSDKHAYPYHSRVSLKANKAMIAALEKGIPTDARAEAKNVMSQHAQTYRKVESTKKERKSKKSELKKKKVTDSDDDGDAAGGLVGEGLGTLGTKASPLSVADFKVGKHYPAPWQLKDALAMLKLSRKELESVHRVMAKKAMTENDQFQSAFRLLTRAFIDAKNAWVAESVENYVSLAQVASRGVYRIDVFMYNEMCALILSSTCKFRGHKGRFFATSKALVLDNGKGVRFSEDAEKRKTAATSSGSEDDEEEESSDASDDDGSGSSSSS